MMGYTGKSPPFNGSIRVGARRRYKDSKMAARLNCPKSFTIDRSHRCSIFLIPRSAAKSNTASDNWNLRFASFSWLSRNVLKRAYRFFSSSESESSGMISFFPVDVIMFSHSPLFFSINRIRSNFLTLNNKQTII